MHTEDEDDDIHFLFRIIGLAFQIAVVILFVAFTLLTLGIFLPEDKPDEKKKSVKKVTSIEERLRIDLERKQHRLIRTRKRINELQLITAKIVQSEQRILFWSRMIILLILVIGNVLYLKNQDVVQEYFTSESENSKHTFSDIVELVTNLNALILLFYSIPAYLLYGTIGRFTAAMKTKVVQILRRKHIPSFSELQALREEEKLLTQDIRYLELRLKEF